jgi:hypothetical protein
MGTSAFLVAHPQKQIFEIGGSWMHDFPNWALLDRDMLVEKLREFVGREEPYTQWLADQMYSLARGADWDVSIILEGGRYDTYRERGYKFVGTYFPLRATAETDFVHPGVQRA